MLVILENDAEIDYLNNNGEPAVAVTANQVSFYHGSSFLFIRCVGNS